ncbi:hypothetical protein [Aquipuribacter nitratireducens]|uniref:Type IV toxin-antitoxin system AbiEi family antitoxin domain-containing protein n=1 Tax=Aquipuribacter nitratireducens TaxID=650104 RepID=A0ABW0GQ65_9MICO
MALEALAAVQDGVVTGQQLHDHGVTVSRLRTQLRLGRWVRIRRNAYLLDLVRNVQDPWVQARAVSLTMPGVVVSGASAARLWGIEGATAETVEVTVPRRRALRARPDLAPRRREIGDGDVTLLRGIPVTTALRTVRDLVLDGDRLSALAVCDSALHKRLLLPGDLLTARAQADGLPGSAGVADIWALADGRAESVLESRVRLRCIDGLVPPDDLQVVIRASDGRFVARADLAWSRRSRGRTGLLVVEADGRVVHGTVEAAYHDRSRQNDVVGTGHDMLRVTWRDTTDALTIPRAVRTVL